MTHTARLKNSNSDSPADSHLAPEIYDLVQRQARAWECNDFELAATDWLPDGVLIAPAGHFPYESLPDAMADFHRHYKDLVVDIKNVFASPDGSRVAIEWNWSVTRRADGARSLTEDAIIVDLIDGKIKSWREYFDLSTSVESPNHRRE